MRTCPECQSNYSDEVEFCPRDATRLPQANPATQFDLAIGLAARYRIVRRLGEGGMGTVFLAEQVTVGNRLVALKVLRRRLLDDPEFLRRFREEASSTGRIHHPNVVTVYECGQTEDGSPYIAMEYLEGETLCQTIARRGALKLPEVAEILQQAARGLNAAHKLGIIHRDLKPDNIFLTQDDEGKPLLKIVDFGIAKMRESSTHTATGVAIGTPAYMSYEQASGMRSEAIDARSDIYSLGIVTYEMITGRLPFRAETPTAFFGKHLFETPEPIGSVPPPVEQAVMRAIAKQRDERYANALDFAREFSRAIAIPPAAPPQPERKPVSYERTVVEPIRPVAPTPAPPQPAARVVAAPAKKSMSFGVFVGIMAVLLVVVAVPLVWFAVQTRNETEPQPDKTPLSVVTPPTVTDDAPKEPTKEPAKGQEYANQGFAYRDGNGVARDYALARENFEKGAAEGNGDAMNGLGLLYENGEGVTRDYDEARNWFSKGAGIGNAAAMNNLGWMAAQGEGQTKDYVLARGWYEKSAAAGSGGAMDNLGDMYKDGLGVERDYAEARQWYQKGAEAGDASAMDNLGWLWQHGWGGAKDYTKAREWYEKGAQAYSYMAMNNLGNLYWEGNGVPQDYSEAKKWYDKAAAGGNTYAMESLGDLYHEGHGVERDDTLARQWYEKAVAGGDEGAKTKLQALR